MHVVRSTVQSLPRLVTRLVVSLVAFLGLYLFQMLGLPQPITGPVVNGVLLAAALGLGMPYAVGIGLLTPIVAYARGILAAPLAPMIPFIALGNAIYVVLFSLLVRKQQPVWGVLIGACVKFVLLSTAVTLISGLPEPVTVMMKWPQLATALAGGFAVLGIDVGVRRWKDARA